MHRQAQGDLCQTLGRFRRWRLALLLAVAIGGEGHRFRARLCAEACAPSAATVQHTDFAAIARQFNGSPSVAATLAAEEVGEPIEEAFAAALWLSRVAESAP